jgi:hypothetical protein
MTDGQQIRSGAGSESLLPEPIALVRRCDCVSRLADCVSVEIPRRAVEILQRAREIARIGAPLKLTVMKINPRVHHDCYIAT